MFVILHFILQFLKDFVEELQSWKSDVASRQGFTNQEKEKMFLSKPTFDGIVMTGMYKNMWHKEVIEIVLFYF